MAEDKTIPFDERLRMLNDKIMTYLKSHHARNEQKFVVLNWKEAIIEGRFNLNDLRAIRGMIEIEKNKWKAETNGRR